MAKPYLLLAFILAGCGGQGNSNWQQVAGEGFTFLAPSVWTVDGPVASHGKADRVEVRAFRLEHPYRPAERSAVSAELLAAAESVAGQLKGNVTSRTTLRAGGLDAWRYEITYGDRLEEITFALDGSREYELLCRREADGSDSACKKLLASFKRAT